MKKDYISKKPALKPARPFFSSGPTSKPLGWNVDVLSNALVGRSHRSLEGKQKLKELLLKIRQVLEIPHDYEIALLTGSATAAMETLLWNFLGLKSVDVFSSDVFSKIWENDILHQLKISKANIYSASFGELYNFTNYNPSNDCVFTWNGSTTGVIIPQGNWISSHREGLTLCDATSAAFCVPLPWDKLDATAFSLQKGIGGEGAHGIIVLSPKAIERLQTFKPSWPIPRLFSLHKEGKFNQALFKGETINTPSLLCVEDALWALDWALLQGGASFLFQKCLNNFNVLKEWVLSTPYVSFVAKELAYTSPVSVCLNVYNPNENQTLLTREELLTMALCLRQQEVAFDIVNHVAAPPSFRIWCGPTVEANDIFILTQWIDWALSNKLFKA